LAKGGHQTRELAKIEYHSDPIGNRNKVETLDYYEANGTTREKADAESQSAVSEFMLEVNHKRTPLSVNQVFTENFFLQGA
jgi:hypothetical protein